MRTTVVLGMALLAACGTSSDPGASGTDTDAGSSGEAQPTWGSSWSSTAETTPWNIDTENPPQTSGPVTTGADTGEDSEGEESEGEEEDFIGWFGYGAVVPGESYAPEGEVIVFVDGVDHCILIWDASAVPAQDCEACEGAFTMTIEGVEVESDEDCSLAGTDADMLPGTTLGVGWNGEDLWVNFGEGWALAEGGFAELVEDRGEFAWELPLVE